MQKEFLTPAAILIGSAIVGISLYLGLQGRSAPAASEDDDVPSSQDGAPARTSQPRPPALQPAAQPAMASAEPGLGPPAVTIEFRKRVEADALKALEAKRADFVKTCWDPSFKKNPNPSKAKYLFSLSFDPAGREIARGISDVRGMERPDTGQCLRSQPMGLTVPPPGAYVGVEIELILP